MVICIHAQHFSWMDHIVDEEDEALVNLSIFLFVPCRSYHIFQLEINKKINELIV